MDTDLDGMIKGEKDVHLEGETMTFYNIEAFSHPMTHRSMMVIPFPHPVNM